MHRLRIKRRWPIHVTARVLEAADRAQSALDLARARAEARAVMVEARPDGAPAILNSLPMPSGTVPILAAADLTLPGFSCGR